MTEHTPPLALTARETAALKYLIMHAALNGRDARNVPVYGDILNKLQAT